MLDLISETIELQRQAQTWRFKPISIIFKFSIVIIVVYFVRSHHFPAILEALFILIPSFWLVTPFIYSTIKAEANMKKLLISEDPNIIAPLILSRTFPTANLEQCALKLREAISNITPGNYIELSSDVQATLVDVVKSFLNDSQYLKDYKYPLARPLRATK